MPGFNWFRSISRVTCWLPPASTLKLAGEIINWLAGIWIPYWLARSEATMAAFSIACWLPVSVTAKISWADVPAEAPSDSASGTSMAGDGVGDSAVNVMTPPGALMVMLVWWTVPVPMVCVNVCTAVTRLSCNVSTSNE